jgi:hypothetical protein
VRCGASDAAVSGLADRSETPNLELLAILTLLCHHVYMTETPRDHRPPARRDTPRDGWVDAGTWIVGLTAAVASWAGWVGLAKLCGWTDSWTTLGLTVHLAWLLPFAVDVYALVGFRVWLRIKWASAATKNYARKSTFVAIGLGVAGNASYHLMVSLGWGAAPWLVVVGVSSLPPLMLGAAAHMSALITRDLSAARNRDAAETTPPVQQNRTVSRATVRDTPAETAVETAPAAAVKTTQPSRQTTPARPKPKTTHPGLRVVSTNNDGDHLDAIRRTHPDWQSTTVSLGQIKTATGISGQATAVRLKRALYADTRPAETTNRDDLTAPDSDRHLIGASA